MGVFLLIILAIVVIAILASLFRRLDELRNVVERLNAQAADRLLALEARLGAQERLTAELRLEIAERFQARQGASIESPVEPSAAEPISAPEQTIPTPAQTEVRPAVEAPLIAPQPAPTAPEPVSQAAEFAPEPPPPLPQPAFTAPKLSVPSVAPAAAHALSLEERLGANWLNKLGIAILVIGLAFFLAVRLTTMGPGGKVLTGLAISLALLGGGVWLERKQTYRIFARGGIGGGWALLFFTTYAMHHLDATRVIASLVADLLLMLLVAAGMVLHSLRYRSQTVTGLAFLLGYATVATSHLESANGTLVFSLLASAVLALGLVVVTTLRHWAWLELAGLVGVMANHFLWLSLVIPATSSHGSFPLAWPSTALILFYWILFRAAYLFRKPLDPLEDRVSSLSAIITGGGVIGLFKYQSTHPEWAFRALLALGILELLLGVWSRNRRRSAFVVLTTIGTVLLIAAIPFHFHGISWPILWIAEAHVLALCGLRLDEPIFRRLGLLAGFCASLVLAVRDVLPLVELRLYHPDPSHHWSLGIGLSLAAALFWLHGEMYPRRWPQIAAKLGGAESLALHATSWLGAASAATALWVLLPAQWIPVAWLTLVLLLGLAADWKSIVSLALQADILAVLTIPALLVWDFADGPKIHKVPSAIAIALFYGVMRRRTVLENAPAYVAPTYSWIATLLLLFWTQQVVPDKWLTLTWVALAAVLFETGRFFRKGYLRWQGLVPAILAAIALQIHWVEQIFKVSSVHGWFAADWSDCLSFVCVVALAYWLQERTRSGCLSGLNTRGERPLGLLLGAAATLIIAAWLALLAPSWGQTGSEPILWALLASALLGAALAARRRVFQVHAIASTLLVVCYTLYLIVTAGTSHGSLPWWQGNIARMGLASAILLGGLPFAFQLRKRSSFDESAHASWSARPEAIRRPEQWFFFVPFGVMIVTLAAELRAGNITLGWSLLGLGAFVFALLVRERSFRLGGLALLLLCVVKVLLMDVWTLSVTDRYITLIVMGCALLLVSFLYTRFKEIFRRIL
jgi:hypothetical protein